MPPEVFLPALLPACKLGFGLGREGRGSEGGMRAKDLELAGKALGDKGEKGEWGGWEVWEPSFWKGPRRLQRGPGPGGITLGPVRCPLELPLPTGPHASPPLAAPAAEPFTLGLLL